MSLAGSMHVHRSRWQPPLAELASNFLHTMCSKFSKRNMYRLQLNNQGFALGLHPGYYPGSPSDLCISGFSVPNGFHGSPT